MRRTRRQNVTYAALLAGAFALAILLSWGLGKPVDNAAYDWMLRNSRPPRWEPQSIILAIEEDTYHRYRGIANIRAALSDGLEIIAPAKPKAVAIDVVLAAPLPRV